MLVLGFASFVAFGAVLVLLGANQDALARDLSLDLTQTGFLASALSAGLGLGVLVAGPLVDRWPRRPLFLTALLLAALALLGFGPGMGFAAAVGCAALLGFGIGIYDILISTLVAERFLEGAARPMSLVHAGATLGAVLCPLLVGWLGARRGWAASFQVSAAAHALLAVALLALPLPAPPRRRATSEARGPLTAAMLPFALVSFAYVGVETALTLFAVPYAAGALDQDAGRGRDAISALWTGLLGGRLALSLLPGPIDARWLVAAGLLGTLLLGGGVLLRLEWVELHYAATGVALGCVFPLMIALVGQAFPEGRGSAVGLATAAGALGGFALPWLHGALGDAAGPGAAVGSLAVWTLAVAVAAALLRQR